MSVCPTIKAYISVTMSWILMKLGESVGTLVRLIVSKFHCAKRVISQKGKKKIFFFLYFYVFSEHVESIETHFLFENCERVGPIDCIKVS